MASEKGTHSQSQKCACGNTVIESTGITVSYYFEPIGLIERYNVLLKIQIQCQLDGASQEGWGSVLQKVV